jgi:ketosteroid isomerase-like protein
MRILLLATVIFCAAFPMAAQASKDEQTVTELVEKFNAIAPAGISDKERLFADDYVYITADGDMTTSWRIVQPTSAVPYITTDKFHVRVFGDLAVATLRWLVNGDATKTSQVVLVFQKRQRDWRLIATQVGGLNPAFLGHITADRMIAPKNPPQPENEVRDAWRRQMVALDLRTPTGARAEDMDTFRSIIAEDCLWAQPNGDVISREERYSQGHPGVLSLTGKQAAEAVPTNAFHHVDERVAILGNAALWTSRNPDNGDQTLRVWQKRPAGWQQVGIHHGMSYRRSP